MGNYDSRASYDERRDDRSENDEQTRTDRRREELRRTFSVFGGTLSDIGQINERLAMACELAHLLSPTLTVGALPPGCVVSFSVVWFGGGDVHNVGSGKYSLLRHALLRLANAAGVRWDAASSGRLPPDTHPYYVHWLASGARRDLDGTPMTVTGDAHMDLREGSEQCRKIIESASDPARGPTQLRDTRAKILEHAQSKAELRGIRKTFGIRSYYQAEIENLPFVLARLVFTGHDDDPRIAIENKRAIRANMLGGSRLLFGPPMPPRLLPAPGSAELPPVGTVFDGDGEDDVVDMPTESRRAPAGSAPPPHKNAPPVRPSPGQPGSNPAPRRSDPPSNPRGDVARGSGFKMPGGPSKGQPIESASDDDLRWWVDRIGHNLREGRTEPRYRDHDGALLAALKTELLRRNAVPAAVDDDQIPY